jgi:hypothetical protein
VILAPGRDWIIGASDFIPWAILFSPFCEKYFGKEIFCYKFPVKKKSP